MSLIDELTKGLQEAAKANFSVAGSDPAMENIAVPIANAITKGGQGLSWQGTTTVAALNAMPNPVLGGVYRCTGGGTLTKGGLVVTYGDVVIFNGTSWEYLIDLDGGKNYVTTAELDAKLKLYATKAEVGDFVTDEQLAYELRNYSKRSDLTAINNRLYAAEAELRNERESIATHVNDTSNPHSVTAEQVGAYTKEQVDGFIRNWSGYVVVPFGQQKPAASEAELGKIYLVQVSTDPEVKDQYEEWISDGTAWSLIGTMSIDLSPYDKIEDAIGREQVLRDLIDSVAHGTNMVAFEEGQDIFMTILDYFARKPVPWAATFFARDSAITNTLTNYPPILKTDSKMAGFKIDCFCLYDLNSPGSDEKPDYARAILLEYTNNNSDAGYIKFIGRIGNSSHTRPTKPANSYWEQFLNSKMCDGTFNYKSNKVATVKTVTDKINALDVNDAAVANQFVTAVKETDGKVSITRRQPVMADVSGLAGALEERDAKITALEGDLQDLKSKTLDMKVDSDVVEFFMMEA